MMFSVDNAIYQFPSGATLSGGMELVNTFFSDPQPHASLVFQAKGGVPQVGFWFDGKKFNAKAILR